MGRVFFDVEEGKEVECRGEKKKQWSKGGRWVHMAAQMDHTENEERRGKKKSRFLR